MFATVTDPDGGLVAARFAIWPVDQPADRYEVTTSEKLSGVADVASFRYGPSEFNTTFVAADALGGSATGH